MTGHIPQNQTENNDNISLARVRATCSCGWAGPWHDQSNDYAFRNASDDFKEHLSDLLFGDGL